VAAIALASGILLGWRALPPPPGPLDGADPPLRQVEAQVIRGPDAEEGPGGRWRLWLAVRTLDGAEASGLLALTVIGSQPVVGPGDLVRFRAAPREPVGLA